MCTSVLATGKKVKTDCSITLAINGKTYCFGNEDAMTEFMKDPDGNLAKATSHQMTEGKTKAHSDKM